jgi:hypothetical protein
MSATSPRATARCRGVPSEGSHGSALAPWGHKEKRGRQGVNGGHVHDGLRVAHNVQGNARERHPDQ